MTTTTGGPCDHNTSWITAGCIDPLLVTPNRQRRHGRRRDETVRIDSATVCRNLEQSEQRNSKPVIVHYLPRPPSSTQIFTFCVLWRHRPTSTPSDTDGKLANWTLSSPVHTALTRCDTTRLDRLVESASAVWTGVWTRRNCLQIFRTCAVSRFSVGDSLELSRIQLFTPLMPMRQSTTVSSRRRVRIGLDCWHSAADKD